MIKLVVGLTVLTVLGAVAAAFYYQPGPVEFREADLQAFNLAPGAVKSDGLQAAPEGSPVHVTVTAIGGPIDVYVVETEWAAHLPGDGELDLSRPFTYHAEWSRTGVNGTAAVSFVSDGVTSYDVIFDNSDNFYEGDAVPDLGSPLGGVVSVGVEVRYLQEEERSLLFGYLATVPSVLLVLLTVGRKLRRRMRARRAA